MSRENILVEHDKLDRADTVVVRWYGMPAILDEGPLDRPFVEDT